MQFLDWDYNDKHINSHRAFLLSGDGLVYSVFVWDNEHYDFVSGDVFDCSSWNRSYDISSQSDLIALAHEDLYEFDGEYVFSQYVKHDGSSYIRIDLDEEDKQEGYFDLQNLTYQQWIRLPLFVQSVAMHIYNNDLINPSNSKLEKFKEISFNEYEKPWSVVIFHDDKIELDKIELLSKF